MIENKKDNILYKICRTIAVNYGDGGVSEAVAILGEGLSADGAFTLRSNEIPSLLEVENLWEADVTIGNDKPMLDLTETHEWDIVNPFSDNEEKSYYVCADTAKAAYGEVIRNFVSSAGVGSFVVFCLKHDGEYLGLLIVYNCSPRLWRNEEIDIIREAAEVLGTEIAKVNYFKSSRYLINESDKSIKATEAVTNRFISNLSHEIRTPINAVIGMISIMRHNLESTEVMSECLDRMEKSSKQMMDTVNNCIDMAMINNNEVTVNNNWIAVGTIVEDIRKGIKLLLEGRRQTFEAVYDENLMLYADPEKLERILVNTITSSCYEAEPDTVIRLTIGNEDGGSSNMVTFRIHDEVKGVDEETAKHMFDALSSRMSEAVVRSSSMGLLLAGQLIDILHGSAECFSDGQGTEAVFQIPLESKGARKQSVAESANALPGNEIAEMYIGRRVLVAEDNVLMGEIVATILGYRGLETDMAQNGKEALDLFVSHDPFYYDLILMDIQMPEMDGLEATKAIRASNKADAGMIPIAALSANAFDEDVERALEAGMNIYLRKPVGEKELFAAISSLVL